MKLFIDKQTGTIYRHFNGSDEVAFVPMTISGVVDLNEGGIVTDWQDDETKARVLKALA